MVTFRVLGPIEAYSGDEELDLGGLRQRAVLGRLLVARGHVVPVDLLIHDLWADDASPNALSGLQVYVSRLRRVLEPDRPRGGQSRLLVTVTSGYALRAGPGQVDAWRFETLVRSAGEHLEAGDPARAIADLDTGLSLWHGTPYGGFADLHWAEAEVNRLTELRLVARERRADAGLRLGLHAETVTDLEGYTTEQPLREEGWRLLALGLYRCGRQGDALAALRRARAILSEELGIDPGPALRRLESDILAQDPGLDLPKRPDSGRSGIPAVTTGKPAADAAAAAGPGGTAGANMAGAPGPAGHLEPAAAAVPSLSEPSAEMDPPEAPHEPFLGREPEIERLMDAARASASGRLTIALVSGDAGAGKTTLTQQLAARLSRYGWLTAFGNCPDSSATPPGWAFVELLRGLVSQRGPGEYARLLAPLLDDTAAGADEDQVAGGYRLHRAVGGYLAAVARDTPLLIALEDLHWADDQTLAQLRSLPTVLASSRVMLVATYRDNELNDRQADALAALARQAPVRVGLAGLAPAAVAELVRAICTHEVDEAAVATIMEKTGGNPFFVRETARLLDSEAVGHSTAAATQVISRVPSGVRDVLRRRIARLPQSAQYILLQAAVIGRDVDVDVLVDVTGDEDAVVDAVEAGLLAGLITEPGPGRLRFDHDLVRDTLYGDASRLRRSRLHGHIAAAIERRSPGDVAALAHHFDAAGTADTAPKALHYSRLAAELAERRFAHREAATLWRQAIDAFDRDPARPDGEEGVRARLKLMLSLIRALALAGDMAAARSFRREAMEAAVPLRDKELTARVIASLAVPHKGISRDLGQTAWDIVDATEKALVELPTGEERLRASLLATLALELEGSAGDRGLAASLEAEELARRTGDPQVLALALSGRLRQSYVIPAVEERETIGRELLEVGERSGQVAVSALAHLVLMECSAARGDFAAADEHVAAGERLAKQYDLPAPAAVGAWYSGQKLMIEGRYAEAERAYREAARLTAKAGMLEGRQDLPLITTFCLHLVAGRADEMAEPLAEAHQRGAKWTTDAYALALAAAGHLPDARAIAASRPPVRPDFLYELVMTWRALAGMRLGDRARMQEAYDTLTPFADRIAGAGTGVVALWPVAETLGDLAVQLGLAEQAREHYRKALAVAERVGVPRWIDSARSRLQAV
ncbi:AfsR/SARP family transcriptional regulator [Bailinhaonella thermotolerans]|uniref:ATPase n=1 Tax=Bailinhaonella thermotolerans TaxID=1070861 RepID=A0A3A4AWK8_9ACTN|nr:AfsR/SARP family transcriptional regulator [Bailinhaonella thermotolerans]RJL32677.1 ATPase [Bailinhaonella thermotolerans]